MKKIIRDIILVSIVFSFINFDKTYISEDLVEVKKYAEKAGIDESLPLEEFKTDGCTLWPDSFLGVSWQDKCIEHDIRYWAGGTEEDRLNADLKLKNDINQVLPGMGEVVYLGVRLGGRSFSSLIPWTWGWGYGWNKK